MSQSTNTSGVSGAEPRFVAFTLLKGGEVGYLHNRGTDDLSEELTAIWRSAGPAELESSESYMTFLRDKVYSGGKDSLAHRYDIIDVLTPADDIDMRGKSKEDQVQVLDDLVYQACKSHEASASQTSGNK